MGNNMSSEDSWSKIKEHFLKLDEVQKQGESLKIRKKMFAMIQKSNYVLKLPKERVEELISSGEGLPYDPGNGRIMKEWVIIPEEQMDKWIEYASEAKEFAKTLAK
jgi:TfoX/Sxy family transcriptional regulator of competence genes